MVAELSLIVKVTLVLALGLLAVRLAGRQSAAVRSLILTSTFGLVLLFPIAAAVLPERAIDLPARYAAALEPLPLAVLTATPTPPLAIDMTSSVPERAWRPSVRDFVFAGWAFGALAFGMPLIVALLRARRLRAHARPWTGTPLSSSVEVFVHADVKVPIACGVVRPAITLPDDAPQWKASELRRVLLHEMEHVRRRDWLVHVTARGLCTLYWFHPLVWIAWRQLRLESERACDDAVLREEDGAAYAEQLVSLARRLTKADAAPMLAIASRSQLSTRVQALLANDMARGPVRTAAAVAVAVAGVIAVLGIGPLQAVAGMQSPPAQSSGPSFRSASVRRAVVPQAAPRVRCCAVSYSSNGQMSANNVGLVNLIVSAYELYTWQVAGEPAWASTDAFGTDGDRFDVEATALRNASRDEMRQMLRTLLADRFRLTMHRETRRQQIYELVVDQGGHKLQPPRGRPDDVASEEWLKVDPATMTAEALVDRMTMAQLARSLGTPFGTMVIDRTGLNGEYRVNARWNAAPGSREIFDAFPTQLGLRLQETTGPVDYLVVDRVERPTLDGMPFTVR